MGSFSGAAEITLSAEVEGGWAKILADGGGETYRGIARNKHPEWKGWAALDAFKAGVAAADIKRTMNSTRVFNALDADVLSFYRAEFWAAVHGDEIRDQGLATFMFDYGVNSGPGAARKCLQEALNFLNRDDADPAWPDLEVDGVLGKESIRVLNLALARGDAEALLILCVLLRGELVLGIMRRNETQEAFARGWPKRLGGFIRRLYAAPRTPTA